MYTIITIALAVSGLLALTIFIVGIIYYLLTYKKYHSLMKLYSAHGFREPINVTASKQLGGWGLWGMIFYFRKLLKGKKIIISKGIYLDEAPYTFIRTLDKEHTAWLRRMLILARLIECFMVIALVTFAIQYFIPNT